MTTNHTIPTRLLVLGMVDDRGVVQADRLFAVARAAGQGDEQVRSCLRRMMVEGLFTREGRGQRARYSATSNGLHELRVSLDRARRAFTQDAHALSGGTWDGQWRLVGFEIPESRRRERDELRSLLVSFGAAVVQGGVYLTPHAVEDAAAAAAAELGLDDYVFQVTSPAFTVRGEREPRRVAQLLWPVAELASRYRELVRSFRPVVARTRVLAEKGARLPDERLMPRTLSMASAFMAVHYDDPLLPPELLPQPWPGSEARALVREARVLARTLRAQPDGSTLFSFFEEVMDDPGVAPPSRAAADKGRQRGATTAVPAARASSSSPRA